MEQKSCKKIANELRAMADAIENSCMVFDLKELTKQDDSSKDIEQQPKEPENTDSE